MTYKFDYPEIYDSANLASASAQKLYLRLIIAEFLFLAIASFMSLDLSDSPYYYITYALSLIIALACLLYRSTSKPEQRWYRARALTESIKTTSWRYAMRAQPYSDASAIAIPRAEFRNAIRLIFDNNKDVLGSAPPTEDAQTTAPMDDIRLLSVKERTNIYKSYRVIEQRKWYNIKSRQNARMAKLWLVLSCCVYFLAILTVMFKINNPSIVHSPTEFFIVLASSAVGWIQVKKFNELASAYALTTQEIGFLLARADDVIAETNFSDFVNEAELAFSREHTQWVARLTE